MVEYKKLIDDFKSLIADNRLSHAYLFFGAGKEKSIFGHSLANFLEKKKFEEPTEFLSEFLVISPNEKMSIGIDKIKDIMYYLWQEPVSSSKRIVLIENAEMLTIEAQNAALKIVEEPPERGLIIFLAKTAEDLLPTLNSRVQKIFFPQEARTIVEQTQNNAEKPPRKSASGLRVSASSAEEETDEFFRKSIAVLMKDPLKNSGRLKELLRRLVLIKRFNLNKKLQLRSLV